MIKRILILALALVISMTGVLYTFAAEESTFDITVNGNAVSMQGRLLDGQLYLPLRAVSEELGHDVQWSGETKEIRMSKPENSMCISLSDDTIKAGGHESYIAGGHRLIDDRTYLREDVFSDYLKLEVTWDAALNKAVLREARENSVVIGTKGEASETETLKLNIQYPELSGLDNPEIQNRLNSLFAGLAAEAKGRGYEIEKFIGQDEITRHIKAEVYFNYNVKYNQKGLLSIVFYDYQYSGGAHGFTVQSSYTFDLRTGKEYKIKDLFRDGIDYISMVSSEVKRQMEESEAPLLNPFESIKADQDFYLTNKGIVVYFQLYEYYPYAYGIPEFAADYSLLGESLNPELGF